MKRSIVILLLMLFMLGAFGGCAEKPSVYVTVANGDIAVAYEKVEYKDADGDGKVTINDALILIHDEKFDGGAEKGYASEETQYGLSLTKLWGVSDKSGGYYLNNEQVMTSLAHEINEGDHIYAYIYQDPNYGDSYTFFDKTELDTEKGEEFTLNLKYYSYAPDWTLTSSPLKDAVVTVNGQITEFKTDENGNVTVKLEKKGEYILSIKITDGSVVAVPAICKVNVG